MPKSNENQISTLITQQICNYLRNHGLLSGNSMFAAPGYEAPFYYKISISDIINSISQNQLDLLISQNRIGDITKSIL